MLRCEENVYMYKVGCGIYEKIDLWTRDIHSEASFLIYPQSFYLKLQKNVSKRPNR